MNVHYEVAMARENWDARESTGITIRNKYMPLSKTEHEEEVEVEDVGRLSRSLICHLSI